MAANMMLSLPRPTKTYHTKPYPAILPDRPELSLKGKTVLITGGATGIGLATTHAFAQAGAATIALMARTEQPMLAAKADVESKHPATKVQVYPASITSRADIDRVLAAIGHIDVLVLNAGHMHPPGPALRLCAADLTTDFDINVLGPMNLLNAFTAMPSSGERTVIHTSSAGAYLERPGLAGYNASKLAMSYMIRMIAAENAGKAGTNESIRAFTFHPALAYTPMAANVLGLKEDQLEYDDKSLPANFAVWLCSPEADFLQGRFLWAHWDVDELKAKKDLIEDNPFSLKTVLHTEGLEDRA